jgi:hypothetical protein
VTTLKPGDRIMMVGPLEDVGASVIFSRGTVLEVLNPGTEQEKASVKLDDDDEDRTIMLVPNDYESVAHLMTEAR